MKPTKKIQLEIYSDKAEQFYLSLLKYKLSSKKDLELLTALADAIHFDKDSLMSSFELPEAKQKKINDKLFEIHNYLLKSKKDSEDYFMVSKENFEKFQTSPFGKELHDMFFTIEITKQWIGKEESTEVKAATAMLSWFLSGLMHGISESIGKSINKTFNAAIALNDTQPFSVKPNKKGNLVCKTENETIEMELFVEKSGHIRKVSASDLEKIYEENIFYVKVEDRTVRIKHIGDKIELTHYEKAKVKNQKLDLSKATILETVSVPKDHYEKAIKLKEDGSLVYHPQESSDNPEIIVETTHPIVYNYEDMLKQVQKDKETEEKSNIQSSASVFAMLDENFSAFLKLPKNNPEKVQARDKIIISLYELLKEHYAKLSSQHSYTTITGYISSRIELLDSEDLHDESKRRQPYRKYLRDMAYNILKSNSIL